MKIGKVGLQFSGQTYVMQSIIFPFKATWGQKLNQTDMAKHFTAPTN